MMNLEWLEEEHEALCPVCETRGTRRALLATGHVLPPHPRIKLLQCQSCGAAFLQDLSIPDYGREIDEWLDYYVELGAGIDLMTSPLLRIPPGSVERCLEVGCGFGFALDFARHTFGWDVVGVDPSPLAAAGASALGFPVSSTYFDADLDLGPRPFDLVLCSEILEHVAEPHSLLSAIRNRLSAEGLLVLSTPNLAVVRKGTDEGTLSRALSPGLHLILYDRHALAFLLRKAGFSHFVIEESTDTLRAFAACSAAAIAGLGGEDQQHDPALLRDYFAARLENVPPSSSVACGFAWRHFKECMNGGLYEDAAASRLRLARIYREHYGLDLEKPEEITQEQSHLPFNLAGALFFCGLLELNHFNDPGRAASYFAASIDAGSTLLDGRFPFSLHDGETEGLVRQSRKHLPMALAASDPERAAVEIDALALLAGKPGTFSWELLAETRAQTFVRLVNSGAYAVAARLAPDVEKQIDMQALEEKGEQISGALDAPYCLGMLALQEARFTESASMFERVFNAAARRSDPARAELLWSARFHQALSLGHAGESALAREAAEEVASGSGRAQLPAIPDHLAQAARSLLAAGDR